MPAVGLAAVRLKAGADSDFELSVRAIEGIEDVSKRGYEWEVSKDLERSMPKTNPNSVILDLRTMTSGTAGANTIQTTVDSSIQDFIQAKSIMNLMMTNYKNIEQLKL